MDLNILKFEIIPAIRKKIVEVSSSSNSAHVGSSLSCVELLAYLFYLKITKNLPVEKIILSKGHAAMALYSTAEAFGLMETSHLEHYLKDETSLWGHPSKSDAMSFIDWSTGSLGHGMPATVGFAYSAKYLNGENGSIYSCIISDGECNEGSNWEAILFAAHHKLSNLVIFVDYNKIQSFGFCRDIANLEPFVEKWESFGWKVQIINGHNVEELDSAFMNHNLRDDRPLCIIANTIKGKGVPSIEGTIESHYKPITVEQLEEFYSNEK